MSGRGRQVDYGAFTVEASIASDGPHAVLTFADPLPAAGLKDVRVALSPIAGGFRIENQAGRRTQSALNEEPPVIEWTNEALAHYRIHVGQPGDRSYLLGAWQISELTAR